MATQMEYLHMQQPIDGVGGDKIITGVPVTLTAIDENGNIWLASVGMGLIKFKENKISN